MAGEVNSWTFLLDELAPLALWIVGSLLITAILLPASLYLQRDYLEFISLGPGGTPQSISGYIRVKALGCFALRDRYQPPRISSSQGSHGYLTSLPTRNRPRPDTRGIAPHRQVTQTIARETYSYLTSAISQLATESNDGLVLGTSCFEKHNVALFSTSPKRRTCRGEVCHAHPSDGSMHLTLEMSDAKKVLEADWGEWHPLARGVLEAWFVPRGFLLIYAPLDEHEVDVVLRIVAAAASFVGGEVLSM